MQSRLITDFSKTLTLPGTGSTWSMFGTTGILGEEYQKQRDELFRVYHPYELVGDIDKVTEWFDKHLALLRHYEAIQKIDDIAEAILRVLRFRPGTLELLTEPNTQVYILSSGVSELIRELLLRSPELPGYIIADRLMSGDIHIIANDLDEETHSDTIHPLNKRSFVDRLYQNSQEPTRILGDSLSDIPYVLRTGDRESIYTNSPWDSSRTQFFPADSSVENL